MNSVLTNKVALITGASRGIGRAIAQRIASAGALTIITARSHDASTDRHQGTLEETAELIEQAGGRAIIVTADLEDEVDRTRLIEESVTQAGQIDILVNNAGYTRF